MKKTLKKLSAMALICVTGLSCMGYTSVSAMQIEQIREEGTCIDQQDKTSESTSQNTTEEGNETESSWKNTLGKENVRILYKENNNAELLVNENALYFIESLNVDDWEETDLSPETSYYKIFYIEEPASKDPDTYITSAVLTYFPKEQCVAITAEDAPENVCEEPGAEQGDATSVYRVPTETTQFLDRFENYCEEIVRGVDE